MYVDVFHVTHFCVFITVECTYLIKSIAKEEKCSMQVIRITHVFSCNSVFRKILVMFIKLEQ